MKKTPTPTPTPILLLIVLAAVTVGAFLFWSGGDRPDVRPMAPTDEAANTADQAAADLAAAAAAVGLDGADLSLPDDFLRDEVSIDDEPSGRPLVVQVWQGKKGNPAPAAEVFMLEGTEAAKKDSQDPFASHISSLAETRGRRFDADAQGRVELPPVQEWAIVTARLPGSYGFTLVRRDHGAVETVLLQGDETVTVRVVDGKGNTVAGVPVGVVQRVPVRQGREQLMARMRELEQGMQKVREWIAQNPGQRDAATPKAQAMRREIGELQAQLGGRDGGGRGDRGGGAVARPPRQPREQQPPDTRTDLRAQRRTDGDGLAVFRHFQIHRNGGEKWWPEGSYDRFEAVLLMPLQRPESRAFGGRPVPEEILELRLPDTGSIALRTVDRDGRPFTHPVHAELRLDDPNAAAWSRLQVRKAQNEPAVVYPFVGLGLGFTADCRLDDEDFRWRASLFLGPTRPGERVEIDLVVAPNEGMLFGRLCDAAGQALADEPITFLINGMAGRLEGEEVLLDRSGRFHLPYQMRPHHKPPFNLQIRRPGVVPVAGLSLPLESLPRQHVTDIGELRLDGLGVVAQGIVVDDRGLPILGARVQLHRERNVGQEQVKMEFREEAFAAAETDSDGRFALLGELVAARYRLHVQAKEHFDAWTPDLRRGDPQNIELPRRSRLLGTVLRPEWLLAKDVRAELSLATDPRQKREDQIRDYKGKTFVYFDQVRPGVYSLTLRTSQFPDPFLRIDGIVIEPGQMDVHPRIRDIDLGACLYRFEIFAVDELGQSLQPRRPLLARIQRPDGSSGYVGLPWQKGRVEMLSTSPQTDVIVMAEGYAIEPAVVVAGRSELCFQRIPPVEVQLTGMKALAGATSVRVVLEALDDRGLPQQLESFDGGSRRIAGWYARAKYTAAMLGDDDIARVQLIRRGPHKVILRFGAGQGIRPPTVELTPLDIAMPPVAGPQRLVVDYDPQVVQHAIAEAAQEIAANQQNGK